MGQEIPGGLEELKGITWELLKLFSYEVRRRLPRSQRWEPCIKEGCDHLSTWNGVNCLFSSAGLCQQHLLCSLLCPCALCWVCASRLGGLTPQTSPHTPSSGSWLCSCLGVGTKIHKNCMEGPLGASDPSNQTHHSPEREQGAGSKILAIPLQLQGMCHILTH